MKNILITGAGRGIGFATARKLYCQDNNLFLVTKSRKSFQLITREFPGAHCFMCDLSSEKSILNFISGVKKNIKSLDVLVNNAGNYTGKLFTQTATDDLDQLYRIHLKAPFILIKEFLPLLENATNPLVINLSSAAAMAQLPTESAYTALKAGLTAMGKVLQNELQNKNIRLTNIHPWTVNTHKLENSKNYLEPGDIADLVNFIININPRCEILNVEISATKDWRGSWPPWVTTDQ